MDNTFVEIGHHGTYLENLNSILEKNFFESEDHKMWFGDGVYFFVSGKIWDSTIDSAKQYALDTRFKDKGADSNEEVCVIEAEIIVNNDTFLNLDDENGLSLFNLFRQETWKKILESGKTVVEELQDYHILKQMRAEIGIEFVKKSVFIKFGLQRKMLNTRVFETNIPNVTIFVVSNPQKNIPLASIKQVL